MLNELKDDQGQEDQLKDDQSSPKGGWWGSKGLGSDCGCRNWGKWTDQKESERDRGNGILSIH